MEGIKKGILKGFLELDEKLRKIPEVASGEDKSGTTAVCALISQVNICKKIYKTNPKNNQKNNEKIILQKYLIIANCGDSRSLVCTAGKPVLATQVSPGDTTQI